MLVEVGGLNPQTSTLRRSARLLRCLARVHDFGRERVAGLMTRQPRTIGPERLAIDCIELMETSPKVTQLLVVDAEERLVGALHLHDLFRARVV